jgi:hypothetical protein
MKDMAASSDGKPSDARKGLLYSRDGILTWIKARECFRVVSERKRFRIP